MDEREKLGIIGSSGESLAYIHPRTYVTEGLNGGGKRLRIGVHGTKTLRALLSALDEPYWILYLHLVSRTENEAGRYQSDAPWNRDTLERFLDEYRDLLQTDGRCDLWIKSLEGPGLLVYDRHEIVFAYGDLHRFQMILDVEGYTPGEVTIPFPHQHPYRSVNDAAQRRLFAAFEWTRYPLAEADLL